MMAQHIEARPPGVGGGAMMAFAALAPRLSANGYLPVPIKPGTKRPPMAGWPTFRLDDAALAEYRRCGTGLLCGNLLGCDIDVLHEAAAGELHQLARAELGDGPARIGKAPKLLVAFRTATPFRKRQTRTFVIDGHPAKVEMLADGQQFVAFAVHPDTKEPYRWLDGDPLAIPFADLPEVTEGQIIKFLGKAETVLAKYGRPEKPERVNGSESPRDYRQPPDDDPARRAYVEAAFADETKRVATAYANSRNDVLNTAALKLARLVAGGWLDQGRVERALDDAAHANGLVRDDGHKGVRDTIRSGLAAGLREPRDPPERQGNATGGYRGNGASAPYSVSVVEPSGWQDDTSASSIPHLSEALWAARPVLTLIREYAHSRTSSGDAALGYLLARTAAFMPHRVRVDSGILRPTPPNLFALLIGGAGAGKSSTHEVFKEILLPDGINDPADYLPVGTGEGVAEAFMGSVEVPGGTKKKPATERRQVRHNAFFTADEGAVIKKLGSRDGATLGETLRRAFTGSTLGQSNASKDTTRKVENYNLGLVANFTPGAAVAVLDDAEAGTPQRFLWFAATDPSMPEEAVSARPPVINTNPPEPTMWVCPRLRKAIREHRVAVVRGEITIPELDGHKQLILLRVAAILAVWDGRAEISQDDYDTAAEIWKTSCGVRDWIIAERRRLEEEAEADSTRRAAVRSVVVSQAVKDGGARITMLARRVALKVHEKGRLTNRDITRNALCNNERGLLPAIVAAAETLGWLVPDGEHAWRAGPSRPV
jgi:bifunctional DNA primase/polymerase-like protein